MDKRGNGENFLRNSLVASMKLIEQKINRIYELVFPFLVLENEKCNASWCFVKEKEVAGWVRKKGIWGN